MHGLLQIMAGLAGICCILAAAPALAGADTAIRSLPVPVTTIYPGQVIEADVLTSRRFRTTPQSLGGIATDQEQIVGKESRRRLIAGRPIMLSMLSKPVAIRRGSPSIAFYREDGFSISTPVIALEDGSAGDIIDVRAAATGAVIRVEVTAEGDLAVIPE